MSHSLTKKTSHSPEAAVAAVEGGGAAKRSSPKSAAQLYQELFSKTHGDRIESFDALQEWLLKQQKKKKQKMDHKEGRLLEDGCSNSSSIYHVRRVLYLGSYIHIGTSVVWPHHVTYVDMDQKAVRFFQEHTQDDGDDGDDEIVQLILQLQQKNAHKSTLVQREQDDNNGTSIVKPSFQFINADYNDEEKLYTELRTPKGKECNDDGNVNDDEEDTWKFDLLISSYAGFVSRAGKDFIRRGGWLLANNSHGDASLAFVDSDDWELVGVVIADHSSGDNNHKLKISTDDLDQYMIPKPKCTKKKSTKRKRAAARKEEDDNDDDDDDNDAATAHPSAEEILQLGRGIKYTKDATAYLFRRL